MGTWSTSITGNDTAQDLKIEYTCAFYYYGVEKAIEKIEDYAAMYGFDKSDPEEYCAYVYSLADFMWKKGILTEDIKNRALWMSFVKNNLVSIAYNHAGLLSSELPSFTTLSAFSCILMPSSLKFMTTSYCVLPMVVSKDPPALYFCSLLFSIILLSEKEKARLPI